MKDLQNKENFIRLWAQGLSFDKISAEMGISKQIQGLKERIRDQEDKMARCDEMLLNREIDRDSHQRMISKLKEVIAILRKKVELQESSETGFMKYCKFGIPLLSNLSEFYMNALVGVKQKLLGSIFPAKQHFRENSYRTSPLNPAFALILQKNKVLENEKNRTNPL